MKLIIGLGNPGSKYKNNRHNVGFMVVDKLAKAMNAGSWKKIKRFNVLVTDRLPIGRLVKPLSFMNSSGKVVKKLATYYKVYIPYIWVIHDDLDIKLGEYKVQMEHGPKLHGGVNSIEKELKSESFWRVRIGVDNRDPETRMPGEEYVLQDFTGEEEVKLEGTIKGLVEELCKKLATS